MGSVRQLIAPAKQSDNRLPYILYIVSHTMQPTIVCLTEDVLCLLAEEYIGVGSEHVSIRWSQRLSWISICTVPY